MLTKQGLLRSRRRTRRPFVALCIVSPLILGLGWTALWLFAQREAARTMDGWIATEADHGRRWTCPDRRIGGFPLQLRITCAAPTYHGMAAGDGLDVVAAGLTASVYLYQPNAIEASVVSPLTITRAGEDSPATLQWSAFTIEGRLLAGHRARVAIMADNASFQRQGVTDRAAHAEIRVAPASNAAPQDHAYEVWSKVDQAVVPIIDAIAGETASLSFDEKGVLTALDPSRVEYWPVLVEAWRQAGGGFTLSSLSLTKGDFHAEAQGTLGLDEAHRLTGRLQTVLEGYEALAARFGVSPRALSMGAMLSQLLNHGAAPKPSDKTAITLPVSFVDGRISIGPVVTAQRLSPLY